MAPGKDLKPDREAEEGQYEAGAATCSLAMQNPEPGDVLEHIDQDTPFRLYVYGNDATARNEFTQSLMASPAGSAFVLLKDHGPQDAADALNAYAAGRGVIIDVDAPDFKSMMETLYGHITPLTEEPPQVSQSSIGDAEAWTTAVSRTMRQPAQTQHIGGSGKKP